jgi:hypothetical protein
MSDYIKHDLNPRRIDHITEGLVEYSGEGTDPANANIDLLIAYIGELKTWVEEVLSPAVSGLIEVHRETGIDLKHWEPVLRLVQSAEPTFSIEGEPEW